MRVIVLDNEPVQALARPDHEKHRVVMAHLAGVVSRRRRGAAVAVVVPTAVRVEAGWDRSNPRAAAVNRFRVLDAVLDRQAADTAAGILVRVGVSVADAHLGAVARASTADDVVVLTSDPGDVARAAAPRRVTAIRI
ncbi:MAG: hypothetical protein KY447_10515 [Actinobacteria bacterium]|nr:hypothetical protein [Actinomycetota bacterium]